MDARVRRPRFAIHPLKRGLSAMLHYSGVSRAMARRQAAKAGGRCVRGVNYHETPAIHAASFEKQLQFYQRRFSPVTPDDLAGLLAHGRWAHRKPGLLLSFDDGLRSNYEVAAPLLEKYGFVGWFFIPTGLIDCPPREQAEFAREHDIWGAENETAGPDGRIAMSWEEAASLAKRHVIGCHTHSHRRLSAHLAPDELNREVIDSRAMLERRLDCAVDSFCWVGGEDFAFSAAAARLIADVGFRFAFMCNSELITPRTHRLQLNRTNIEAAWPIPLVTFQLSGLMDARFAKRREQVNSLTRVPM